MFSRIYLALLVSAHVPNGEEAGVAARAAEATRARKPRPLRVPAASRAARRARAGRARRAVDPAELHQRFESPPVHQQQQPEEFSSTAALVYVDTDGTFFFFAYL